jgi:Sec-independent protein translocase protein TatA
MSATLLEVAAIIILLIVAWQLGLAIAPNIMRWIRTLKQDFDEVTEEGFTDLDSDSLHQQHKKEHTNGTRH